MAQRPIAEQVSQRSSERSAGRAFLGVSALLFAASAALIVMWSSAAPGMRGMAMSGGASMLWMPMPGQTWLGMATSFTAMWSVMMVAMMLPSLAPMLWRYRLSLDATGTRHPGGLSALAGLAYFFLWAALGVIAFALGALFTTAQMRVPALAQLAPAATGLVMLAAGALQFSAWKSRHLACCRPAAREAYGACGGAPAPGVRAALRHGLRLGRHCVLCCAGLTASLLAVGVMDVRAMTLVGIGITAERLLPGGARVARVVGLVAIGAGVFFIARAAGLG
ncbi:DUF2182 domain-containing protein [Pandoraea sp.]|uniref:DUF2182 domain-containing protein n=1 Tax=Pandoraea sp. TaxID=1883445 RepID=UPI001216390F|nr:DUF2182 domain-containing protein [Pandoraea sp.]TAL56766.1 MAG: DUF2182 domain-containing protein [Pandoraea sp.]TAM15590.1 MAG: DUF2182 domain-containing protein [Pandoraea sp.]